MIKHRHTRNGIILHCIIGFKVYHKLYINVTLTQAKTAFIEFFRKEGKNMRVILYVRDNHNDWVHVSTAHTEEQVDELMKYASYKVSSGSDIKIEHKK